MLAKYFKLSKMYNISLSPVMRNILYSPYAVRSSNIMKFYSIFSKKCCIFSENLRKFTTSTNFDTHIHSILSKNAVKSSIIIKFYSIPLSKRPPAQPSLANSYILI